MIKYSSLDVDELIKEVQLSENPTELEVALSNRLAAQQKTFEKISEIIDTAL